VRAPPDLDAGAAGRPLCRDCLTLTRPGARRCEACGSPRLLAHPERDGLAIAHIDCDAFFAAIEKRDDPSLADRPVIVGGGRRGVVSTACYLARITGVRSAMPMFKALKLCPQAVVLKPRMDRYREAGRAVRALMLEVTPLVEPVSIDEAFLDLSGTERLHRAPPAITLARLARRIEDEVGISISVGLSWNKFLAKIASDREKPRGFTIIGRAEAAALLADEPVSIIPGVGRATAERLARRGIHRMRDLRTAPREALGREADRLLALSHGLDQRPVRRERETKSVSTETTFDQDRARFDDLEPILWRLCERLSQRLKAAGFGTRAVGLKLKEASFRLRSRSRSGLPPTQLAARLFEASRALLAAECDGTAFRLIGVAATDLCPAAEADTGDLADRDARRLVRVEDAVARLRERFGEGAVQKGLALRASRPAPRKA
jgi:DNA polymerase IV